MKWGVGGINIDGCRLPTAGMKHDIPRGGIWTTNSDIKCDCNENDLGRFPSNFIHDGSDEVMKEFEKYGTKKSGFMKQDQQRSTDGGFHGGFPQDRIGSSDTYGDEGGIDRFYKCCKDDEEYYILKGDVPKEIRDMILNSLAQ